MDTMLGEGQFGVVYKGRIKDGGFNNPYCKASGFVAIKILRCVCVCVCECVRVSVCV